MRSPWPLSALVALALIVPGGLSVADGIARWRTPEGRLYFGDDPPAGSMPLGSVPDQSRSDGRPPAAEADIAEADPGQDSATDAPDEDDQLGAIKNPDRFSVEASRRRRAIERQLRKEAKNLAAVGSKPQRSPEAGEGEWFVSGGEWAPQGPFYTEQRAQTAVELAASQNFSSGFATGFLEGQAEGTRLAHEDIERERALRQQRTMHLEAIVALWREFEELRSQVLQRYAGMKPVWWRDRLRCAPCPTQDEALRQLESLAE